MQSETRKWPSQGQAIDPSNNISIISVPIPFSRPLFSWIWNQLFLMEQTVNPSVWTDGKTVGWAQNAVPVVIKLNDPNLFSHQKQYSLKPEVNEWTKSYCTDFLWCKWNLHLNSNSKVQNDNGSIFKAAVTQGVSKVLGIEYHLHCSWRPQSSEKVEKANGIIKRHLWKLTQKTQDSCFKNLPIALMRVQTDPKKKGLSQCQTVFVHKYCHRS